MIVRISAEAEHDLEAIADRIALDSPVRAISFVQELRDACQTLAESPRAFPLVTRFAAHGIRWRVRGNYLIFYRVGTEDIVVLHVLHGAMDYAAILFPD